MNVFHTVLVTDTVYTLSVTHHGNPSALGTLTWYVATHAFIESYFETSRLFIVGAPW